MIVNVNTTPPTANGGNGGTITCTSNTSGIQIGTAAVAGNTDSWLPATGLSATNIAQPTANPTSTTTYTVTVTGSNGCTATATVTINVNKTVPTADAGADKNLNCTTTSTTIGTAGVVGNSYSWSPASGLSSTTSSANCESDRYYYLYSYCNECCFRLYCNRCSDCECEYNTTDNEWR
ncbi:MAG: hypothetical protein HWD58_11940 [Bacteroidota bacterium]|nr:MAG: hypothetical protein HWD58_11940 [Bacteroidota bacterium]